MFVSILSVVHRPVGWSGGHLQTWCDATDKIRSSSFVSLPTTSIDDCPSRLIVPATRRQRRLAESSHRRHKLQLYIENTLQPCFTPLQLPHTTLCSGTQVVRLLFNMSNNY